ncbi:MAG: hypothetical protein LBP26_04160 [Clostridiales bacterium]|nr:hypothetical protein [Clostridiales bacterium]
MSDSFATGIVPPIITQSNCYHSNNLTSPVITSKTTAVAVATMQTAAWQRDTLGFDPDIWSFIDGEYPTLK